MTDLNQENQDISVKLRTEDFSHCTSIMTWKPPMRFHVFLHYTVTVLKMFRYVMFFCIYFWPRFYIMVLGIAFFPFIYFTYSIWTFISLFYLDFCFPFLFGLLFPFSIWTSPFQFFFYSIAVTFLISSNFFKGSGNMSNLRLLLYSLGVLAS